MLRMVTRLLLLLAAGIVVLLVSQERASALGTDAATDLTTQTVSKQTLSKPDDFTAPVGLPTAVPAAPVTSSGGSPSLGSAPVATVNHIAAPVVLAPVNRSTNITTPIVHAITPSTSANFPGFDATGINAPTLSSLVATTPLEIPITPLGDGLAGLTPVTGEAFTLPPLLQDVTNPLTWFETSPGQSGAAPVVDPRPSHPGGPARGSQLAPIQQAPGNQSTPVSDSAGALPTAALRGLDAPAISKSVNPRGIYERLKHSVSATGGGFPASSMPMPSRSSPAPATVDGSRSGNAPPLGLVPQILAAMFAAGLALKLIREGTSGYLNGEPAVSPA